MMTSFSGRFRQSLSRALSMSSDDENKDGEQSSGLLGKSVKLLSSKLGTNHPPPEMIHKTLLVVDTRENDWSKTFRGRTLHNNTYDIRIEQASFSELDAVSSSDRGATVSMKVIRNGTVVARSFRPDFVLIREYVRGPDLKQDCSGILFGLMHGLVPSLNSLSAIYNFLEKPVVYAELLKIQHRLGKEQFPLVEQNYYQSYREMLLPPSLPVVVKVGSANSGYGKVCVASPRGFHDVASVVAMTDTYATSEPFLDAKFDLRIYKFGQRYKVYKRRSLSESWKTNTGASVVEEIALTERYKLWADECSQLFGGVDILAVEAIHTKDNKEFIVDVNETAMSITQDKKDEDMKCIANLVIKRMEQLYPAHPDQGENGYSVADAIHLIGTPSPPVLKKKGPGSRMEPPAQPVRPGSAPPPEMTPHTPHRLANGTAAHHMSNSSLNSEPVERIGHNRRGSLAGRFFGAQD